MNQVVTALRSPFVWRSVTRAALVVWFVTWTTPYLVLYLQRPFQLWSDAHVYFRATQAWIQGGDPWAASWANVTFNGPPPTLLLNLPLLPLGEDLAVVAWIFLNVASIVLLFRRFRIPWYWVFFVPISEGFLAATPDITLAAGVIIGGAAAAALSKPYSIPVLVAEQRWRSLALAALLVVVTVPLLPWRQFLDELPVISAGLARYSRPISAWPDPIVMVAAAGSLALIGWKRGLALLTTALWPMPQPHYSIFALGVIRSAPIVAVTLCTPYAHIAAFGVMAVAVAENRHATRVLVRAACRTVATITTARRNRGRSANAPVSAAEGAATSGSEAG